MGRHWHIHCQDLDHLLYNLPNDYNNKQKQHVLMVPVADLINFGKPCTKAIYNETTHAFEIIATCNIKQGDEITFWYTNDCKDVVYANFGFSHSLIPSCDDHNNNNNSLLLLEYKERNNRLINRLKLLQNELVSSWENVEQLQLIIQEMQRLLQEC